MTPFALSLLLSVVMVTAFALFARRRVRAAALAHAASAGRPERERYAAAAAKLKPLPLLLLASIACSLLPYPRVAAAGGSYDGVIASTLALIGIQTCVATLAFARLRAHVLGVPFDGRTRWIALRSGPLLAVASAAVALAPVVASVVLARRARWSGPTVAAITVAATLAGVVLVFVCYPRLLTIMTGARPLGGVPRQQLDALADRGGVRVGGLFLLPSPLAPANAAIAGLWRPRVFVTRALLERFDADHLRAILAHELAHARHRHVARALLVSVVGLAAFAGVSLGVRAALARVGFVRGPLPLVAANVIAAIVVQAAVQLPLQRRREGQADELAARWVGEPLLASALERLAEVSFIPRQRSRFARLWATHPDVASRVERRGR